jgi:dTDP-4-amino-4,6-dideoxygalactose transaminase
VNYWTGEEGRAFEREFAEACGARYGVALMNGTVALELALLSLGVGAGDDVVVTPRSFVASAYAPVTVGARPVFADVDPVSGNVTAATVEAALTPRTRAVVCVHLAGWPCEMDPIMDLAEARGLKVVEHCAQAHGATYKGRPVGAIGHVAAWSFCQDKIMSTAGEGGMLTTNDPEVWRAAWSHKDHGKDWDAVYVRQHAPGFRWLHEGFGTNWRTTEVQAAIGRVQLRKLPGWTAARRRHAAAYDAVFRGLRALHVAEPPPWVEHAYYKYYAFVRPERLRGEWSRDRILAATAAQGLPSMSGSCSEMYLERSFQGAGLAPPERLPNARRLGETSIMLPVHPTLDDATVANTAARIAAIVADATA